MKKLLADLSYNELVDLVASFNQPKFRAKQLYDYVVDYKSFEQMYSLPQNFRNELSENYVDRGVEIVKHLTSKDGTIKFLFKLYDGNIIEGVLMKYKYGNTQCISTQVGCRMRCAFCASGLNGLVRNLTKGEILSQVYSANAFLGGAKSKREITNLVLMGSGEPFDNYNNTVNFLREIMKENNLNISARNVSLSTCGLVDKIGEFINEKIPLNLTISLHSPFDEERKEIMPIAKIYTIKQILDACEEYFKATGRRYILEYVLIKGKNDSPSHAKKLIELLKDKTCLVNLIRLNPVKENDYESVSLVDANKFVELLNKGRINATIRRQIGVDIEGACGQLRQKYLGENS